MFERLYTYLSRISPIVFLLSYVLLIPIFAILFCVLPGQQFYAPYSRYEPPAIADAAEVETNIQGAMVASYLGHESLADGWQVAHSDLGVSDLATDTAKGLTFTVSYFATKHEGDKITASTGGPQFTARLSQLKIVTERRPGWLVCHLVTLQTGAEAGGPATFNQHLLFRAPALALQADSVCWGENEEIALQNLIAGWSGDPRRLSGFLWRMAYFSATTITTVGFGDIVPLSGPARLVTAIEAISGWVMAGLFLNSLASRIAKRVS